MLSLRRHWVTKYNISQNAGALIPSLFEEATFFWQNNQNYDQISDHYTSELDSVVVCTLNSQQIPLSPLSSLI